LTVLYFIVIELLHLMVHRQSDSVLCQQKC